VADNHTHLDHIRGGGCSSAGDVAAAIAAASAVNVTRLVQIGCDLDSARWTIELLDTAPTVIGGVALHPTEAARLVTEADDPVDGWKAFDDAFAEIAALAENPRVRVIGETGLDYHWVLDEAGRRVERASFRRHIDLAKRTGKVLQIHDRDAHDDILAILAEEGAPERTVFHCFSGDATMARFCADQGWFLSFAGPVTFKNAESLRAALRAVPRTVILVETDAPYLTPHPHRGRANASQIMPYTVRAMAAALGLGVDAFCGTLTENTESVYGTW
jgi:TatD DNase family protein